MTMNKKLHVRVRKTARTHPVLPNQTTRGCDPTCRAVPNSVRPEVTIFLDWLTMSNMGKNDSGQDR